MTIDGTDYIAMEKVLPPHYVRVVHKGFTVKLGTVVPEVVDTFPKISSEKEEK